MHWRPQDPCQESSRWVGRGSTFRRWERVRGEGSWWGPGHLAVGTLGTVQAKVEGNAERRRWERQPGNQSHGRTFQKEGMTIHVPRY